MNEKRDLLAACRRGPVTGELLSRLEFAIAGPLARNEADVELLAHFVQNAWLADQREPGAIRASIAARRLTELAPTAAEGYRLLAFTQFSRRDYLGAFQTLTAARGLAGSGNFENYRTLAELMMTGQEDVSFELAGHSYWFPLTTHNAAAIEASAHHAVGALTESEELNAIGQVVRTGARIVEVGVLVGNHSAFFLNALAPKEITLIDADSANIPFITSVTARNGDGRTAIHVSCAFVGARSGETTFAGQTVPVRPLGSLVSGPIEFLKIDVDGGELRLLEGAADILQRERPITLIEVTPSTHEAVAAWFGAHNFRLRHTFDRGTHRNLLLTPE